MKKVADVFDPGEPATEPRASRGAHPSYFRRNLSIFMHFQKKSAPQFHIFSSKVVHFQRWSAPQVHIVSSKIINFQQQNCASISHIFVENCEKTIKKMKNNEFSFKI